MENEFEFGCVEFGLMRPFCVVWQTDSTGLNIYRDVGVVCISNFTFSVYNCMYVSTNMNS